MTANKAMLAFSAMTVGLFGAASAANVSENFENGTIGEASANWVGGTIAEQSGEYAKVDIPGYPITGDHQKMLAVAGTAARTYTDSETGDRVIDMMVMAEELPDEDLPVATGDEQIKLAFDADGCLNLYCTPAGAEQPSWKKISNKVYPSGTWVRVTCTIKYPATTGKAICQIKVDGSSVVSEFGYRDGDGAVTPGSWYKTANECSALSKIDFVGCGAVDDVVNAASDYVPAKPENAPTATNGVDYAWFDEKGLAWSDGTDLAPGGSGYTLKEAFQTGVDPYGQNKLYVSAAQKNGENFTITFNGCGRTYKMEKSATPFTNGAAGEEVTGSFTSNSSANTTTWEGPLPTDALTYYRVRSTDADTAETVNQFVIQKCTASTENTLIALPWTALSPNVTSPNAITAANVLMNANLAEGDWLLYYDNGYKGWTWNGSAWVATETSSLGGLSVAPAAADATLERGRAIWYVRTTANSRDLAKPFYLWGQYQAAKGTTEVAAGGALVANPDVSAEFTVGDSSISSAGNGDRIVVPSATGLPKVFEKRDGAWGTDVTTSTAGPGGKSMTKHTWTTAGDVMKVPAGKGFIYQNKAGSTPTINW